MKKVIDTETKKTFRLINVDFKQGTAVIHNKDYGYCTQQINLLRLPFLNRKLTPPVPTAKKLRIAIVIFVAFFIVWFFELLGYTIMKQPASGDNLPQFLSYQFFVMILLLIVVAIFSAIKWRKDLWKEIKIFINNK